MQEPIGGNGRWNLYQYAPNPLGWIDPLGLTATVGRWMGPSEYQQMLDTGKVIQSSTGTTHVAYPAILASRLRMVRYMLNLMSRKKH